jgi:hypothetical protein
MKQRRGRRTPLLSWTRRKKKKKKMMVMMMKRNESDCSVSCQIHANHAIAISPILREIAKEFVGVGADVGREELLM